MQRPDSRSTGPAPPVPAPTATWTTFTAAQLMGFLFAVSVVWPLVHLTGAFWGFVLAWLVLSLYLLRKPSPAAVLGSGLYAAAGGVILTPVEAYAPTLFTGLQATGAAGAATAIEGAQGLLVWVTVCTLVALAMVAVGRYFKGVAAARGAERRRLRRWH